MAAFNSSSGLSMKLSPIESCKVNVLLDEALNKLQFLNSLGTNASIHREELTQFMGDEISRTIMDQKELQARYEALVTLRDELSNKLSDRVRLQEIQTMLNDVTTRLGESNKNLCRNLRSNPDIPANLAKMQKERDLAQEWINDLKIELHHSFTFLHLRQKVDEEKKALNYLSVVKAREQAASMGVINLQQQLHQEYEEEKAETRQANSEIRKLKEELVRSRSVADIELRFEEKRLEARERTATNKWSPNDPITERGERAPCHIIILRFHEEERQLVDEIEDTKERHAIEKQAALAHALSVNEKIEQINDDRTRWQDMSDREIRKVSQESDIQVLTTRRNGILEELEALQGRKDDEVMEVKLKEQKATDRRVSEEHLAIHTHLMDTAGAGLLQHQGRLYIEKRKLLDSKKGGKKGGKKGLRVKEAFADFDPHRHHLITKSQFIRVLDTSLQSYLQPHQADALAEYYDVNGNGMIHYISFCDDIDEVFCPTEGLEAISPTLEVPQPGYDLTTAFIPKDLGQRYDTELGDLLYRLGLICRTKGFSLPYQFTDFDRHNTGSITATQFFRKFPLYEALTPHEKDILQQRYGYEGNGCEMMNYKSLLQDIEDITNPTTTAEEESSPPHKTGEEQHTVWGDKWYNTSLPLIQLLQAKVVERRLRLREYFKDFDPLKKGTCKR
ncbi:hypothetical protein FOZ63_029549, partial [Perkinsus olseni]